MLITRYIRVVILLVSLCPAWLSATAQGDLSKAFYRFFTMAKEFLN